MSSLHAPAAARRLPRLDGLLPTLVAVVLQALWLPPLHAQRSPLAPRPADLSARAAQSLSLPRDAVAAARLSVPQGAPAAFVVSLDLEGTRRDVMLRLHDLRAPGFVVQAATADGTMSPVSVAPSAVYRGTDGPLTVLARLGWDGLSARVFDGSQVAFQLVPLAGKVPGADREDHAVVRGGIPEPTFTCPEALPVAGLHERAVDALAPTAGIGAASDGTSGGSDDSGGAASGEEGHALGGVPPSGAAPALASGGTLGGSDPAASGARWQSEFEPEPLPAACVNEVEIAFDADFEYFQLFGSSVDDVVARIEEHLNQVDYFYARDLRTRFRLTQVVVRTAPFYAPVSGGDLLDQFRAEWNTTLAGVPRDIAHLMTAKPGGLIEFGGLAWVGVVCNVGLGYGWSLDSAGIVGHEVGHNFGAGHCHDVDPCNNMCGACLYVAPNTKAIKQAYLAGVSCLEPIVFHPGPLPPYVVGESLELAKDDAAGVLADTTFDVTKNDEDGNCQAVLLEGVVSPSAQGATVTVLPGAGPQGRDLLRYEAPADPFVGEDLVSYEAGDGSGLTTVGTLRVGVRPLQLSGWWTLDDGGGPTALDQGDAWRHGTLVGDPLWTGGLFGGGLTLDGIDDAVSLPPLELPGDEATIIAWVRRDGPQNPFAGLVVNRDGSQAGLHLGPANDLRYTWGNALDTFFWAPGLVLPDGEWVFCALALTPGEARLHLGTGGGVAGGGVLTTAVNVVSHVTESFGGTTWIGRDPLSAAARSFRGDMDEVRVYDHALDDTEIADLFLRGGRAHLPVPVDGGRLVDPDASLRWTPGAGAIVHEVYLGATYAGVAAAGPSDPEYMGATASDRFTPATQGNGPLPAGSRWFWRVETVTPNGSVPGPVWQFRVADTGHWRLDEVSGAVAADAHGLHDGSYGAGVGLDKAPATPFTGSSIRLSGSAPQEVLVPALGLATDEATITAWVRRIGDQLDWSGLVFCRGGTTVAGLNVGEANELRYHWDGGKWPWDSGLVLPEAQWAFCALVVEPDRATIWMGVEGAPLVSAVNAESHGAEAFDAELHLGRDPAGNRWFNGRLDDVRVFDRALSPKELQRLYDDALQGSF